MKVSAFIIGSFDKYISYENFHKINFHFWPICQVLGWCLSTLSYVVGWQWIFFIFVSYHAITENNNIFLLYCSGRVRQSLQSSSPKRSVIYVILCVCYNQNPDTFVAIKTKQFEKKAAGEEKKCRRQTQRTSYAAEYTFIETDKYIEKSELEIVIASCASYTVYRIASCTLSASPSATNLWSQAECAIFGSFNSKTFPFIYFISFFFSRSFFIFTHSFLLCGDGALWLASKSKRILRPRLSFVQEEKCVSLSRYK